MLGKSLCALFLGFGLLAGGAAEGQEPARRPNILFILADDLGFADVGCYGGEIRTPNLDRLAAGGLRFTQFYNTGRCWPTRAALLTGYYPQQIRMDPPRGRVPEWTKFLPQYLKPQGYRSYHSGKWHVQGAPRPVKDAGFDRSYKLDDHDRNFYPRHHMVDDVKQAGVEKGSNYYSTIAIADFMIGCLKEHAKSNTGKPFFGYLAFTVPHFPLQAPKEDIQVYRDKYLAGWDVIRQQRYERQLKMGLVKSKFSEREPEIVPHWNLNDEQLKAQIGSGEVARAVPWNSLTEEERRFQATKMAIHAAMIDRMDREIGRVLDQLNAMGVLENTIVMFASDNGTSAEFLNRGDKHDQTAELGSGGSYLCLGPGWSTVGNTPFRLHKSWVHEGGISSPFIVYWPKGLKAKGELRGTPAHVIDFVPTLLELLGGDASPKLAGRSLVKALARDVKVEREYLFFHHESNRALRMGDWKLVSKRPRTNEYALYNLKNDRAEQVNLADKEKSRAISMAKKWQEIKDEFRKTAGAP